MVDNRLYVKTYFRIDAGYVWGEGMEDDQYKAFHEELEKLLTPLGFEFDKPEDRRICVSPTCTRGVESLYCHPMNLSGYVLKDSIPEIEGALKDTTLFKVRNVDTYEEAYNYTPDELEQELANRRDDVEKSLLDAFKTKRSNLVKNPSAAMSVKAGIKRFHDTALEAIERRFVYQVFLDLVQQGKILGAKTAHGWTGYRTVPEPKKARKAS